jgi:hypothetical protein
LESLQRRATQLVTGSRMKSYEERLRHIGLTILDKRKTRDDEIETSKIMTGKEGIDRDKIFQLACNGFNTRGHSMKLYKPRINTI